MSGHIHFDFAELNAKERYKLLIGTVIPRPIAFITTVSRDGQRNAGPFSFINVLTHDPAIVAIGVENYEDGRMKDTSRNIRDTEDFTVHIVDDALARQMEICAIKFGPGVDELAEAGLGGYFCHLDQGHYINGIAAGLATTSNKIGFIAAKPINLVLRNANAFLLGVKKVNPAAEVRLIFTGEWSLPVREAEATNALVDAGCDVIACHVDSPKVVVETAEMRGVKSCGHNADQASLAPKGFITGAELKWGTVYTEYAKLIAAGEKLPNVNEGGYDKDMVASTAFGAGATEAGIAAALAATEELKAGTPIFVGPLKDNNGKVVIEGTLGLYAGELWGTDYLLEGIVGSIT